MKEVHQCLEMLNKRHTTSSCWRLRTFCPHPVGAATPITRATLWDANTSPLHDGSTFTTATPCEHSKLCAGELTASTRHVFFKLRWTSPVDRQWYELSINPSWTTELVKSDSYRVITQCHTHRHISQLLTQRLLHYQHTLSLQLFLPGLMRWPHGTVRPLHTRKSRPQLGVLWSNPWITTTTATIGSSSTRYAYTTHSTSTRILTALRPDNTASPTTTIPQPPVYDRPTSTDNYPCTDPSPRRRPRATTHEIYPVRSSPIQASQSPARHISSPPRGSRPSSSPGRRNPFAPSQGITNRSQGPNFRFHEFTNPLGINTVQGMHVPERIN